MKISIIGAGSYTWTYGLVRQFIKSERLDFTVTGIDHGPFSSRLHADGEERYAAARAKMEKLASGEGDPDERAAAGGRGRHHPARHVRRTRGAGRERPDVCATVPGQVPRDDAGNPDSEQGVRSESAAAGVLRETLAAEEQLDDAAGRTDGRR